MASEYDKKGPHEDRTPNHPISVESGSHPVNGHKLNGQNYLQWSQSVMMYICGKGLDDYRTGKIFDPNMLMSWLVNSMTNEISENFLLYSTAHEIWTASKEFYSSTENTSEIFKIETTHHDLRQEDLTVTRYYNTLTRHWQRLDVFEENQWGCPDYAKKFSEIVERKIIFKFLLGLNRHLDEVRGRILGMKPLLNKAMLGEQTTDYSTDYSALAARSTQQVNSDSQQRKGMQEAYSQLKHLAGKFMENPQIGTYTFNPGQGDPRQ